MNDTHTLEFIVRKGEVEIKHVFDGGGSLVIGRKSGHSIDLALPAEWTIISRQHCKFALQNGNYILEDLSSSNGTFKDGERLAPGSIEVVKLPARFTLGSGNEKVECQVNLIREHHTNHGNEQKSSNAPLLAQLGDQKEIIIGRSQKCDIVLADNRVSRRHARFYRKNDKFFIEDLGSTNGTFVNNERISKAKELKFSDTLFIGLNSLKLKDVVKNLSSESVINAEGIAKVFPNGNRGLHSTTLTVERAEMVAIMGPSGSGKSTLLKMLNGEISLSHGVLKIYGLDFTRHHTYLSAQMGYVPQDDIIHRDLTVEQTLRYAARIRLSADITNAEVQEKIKNVLSMVSLDEPKITKTRVRELSGGQRKRVSIAVELLNDPKLLFLDEPTSPLDPETIDEFLKCLKNLTKNGTTVLMVTHKPEDLAYMDRVVFIGTGGYHAYTGRPDQMAQHFGLDSIIGVYSLLSHPLQGKEWHNRIGQEHSGPIVKPVHSGVRLKKNHLAQWYWQTARYFSVKFGNQMNVAIILLQPLIIALLVTVTFDEFRGDMPLMNGDLVNVADTGLIFLISLASVWFGVSLSAKEIVSEQAIYRRESKMRLSPLVYILSKQVVLSTLLLVQLMIFMFTLAVKYGDAVNLPIQSMGFLFLLGSAAILFGMTLSAFANSAESVMSILPIALMPQIILSGIVSPIKSHLMEVLSYLTFGRWGTEGLARLQDKSDDQSGLTTIEQQLYHEDAMHWCDAFDVNVMAIGGLGLLFVVMVLYKLHAANKKS